jgi:deoxyribonuclease-4
MSCVGGHVSVAGGLVNGILKAQKIGAKVIQIFGSSPRQWACRMPKKESVEEYLEAKKKSNIEAVFLHAPYLVNIGTMNDEHWLKSVNSLIQHLQIVQMIEADGLVFHVGTIAKDSTRSKCLDRAVEGMRMILEHVPGTSQLIIENSAGGPGKIGSSLGDLSYLMKKIKSQRVKICMDTAHAFESGLIEKFTKPEIKKLFDDFDEKIGIDNLIVLHVNDSKTAYKSFHDRHDNIGKGFIGIEGFRNLAQEKRVKEIPWILEVPGFDNHGPDKKNIKLLLSCF